MKLGDQMIDSGMDPTDVYNRVKAYLTAHPDTDGILTLGPNSADPVIKLLRDTNTAGKYKSFITFDLDGDISKAIKDGIVESAIDQQPYLQGYLAVSLLNGFVNYGLDLPTRPVLTGPGIVDAANVDATMAGATAGAR